VTFSKETTRRVAHAHKYDFNRVNRIIDLCASRDLLAVGSEVKGARVAREDNDREQSGKIRSSLEARDWHTTRPATHKVPFLRTAEHSCVLEEPWWIQRGYSVSSGKQRSRHKPRKHMGTSRVVVCASAYSAHNGRIERTHCVHEFEEEREREREKEGRSEGGNAFAFQSDSTGGEFKSPPC